MIGPIFGKQVTPRYLEADISTLEKPDIFILGLHGTGRVMGGYVVRGLFVQEGFGFPVVVKKIIELSLLLFKFKTPSGAEVPSCRRGHAQARLLPCRSPGLRGSGDA
jgi:hypothetical protein